MTQQLQALIVAAGLKHDDCADAEALKQRAEQAMERLASRESYRRGDGDAVALELGTRIYSKCPHHPGRVDAAFLAKIGGKESFKGLFDQFYQLMFADPRMSVLFGWRATELPTAEHGRRLATFILQFSGLDAEYSTSPHDGFYPAHQHAKRCPMRPAEHREAGAFTKQQRNAWLGHLSLACDARKVPDDCKQALLGWLAARMRFYGPFIPE